MGRPDFDRLARLPLIYLELLIEKLSGGELKYIADQRLHERRNRLRRYFEVPEVGPAPYTQIVLERLDRSPALLSRRDIS